MNDLLNAKFIEVIRPGAIVDNAAYTTVEIDTLGWGFATFVVQYGTSDIAMAALKLQECATSGGSFTDVTGLIVGTSTDFVGAATALPSATDDGKVWVLQCDLRNRQRYLDLVATAGDGSTGSYVTAICILSKPQQAPITVAGMASGSVLRVA